MKCVFDGPLKAQDSVLMSLYKRVFPKWTFSHHTPTPTEWAEAGEGEAGEEVEKIGH